MPGQFDEKAIFDVARQIDSEDARIAYLNQVCGDNHRLFDRVSALVQIRGQQPGFLERPAATLAPTIDQPIAEKPGMKIGRYKLVHEIGHGGMGVVYMAVQKEPVKRKVALKIIKPGMDTKEVVARFEAERQALAMMDHQCIATVLDGSSTESGRPYFVMELVSGTPITEYCDAARFTTRQRLELFVQVCQAVQHAHQKGVIHRDIKPSNILVTTDGTVPIPKVIDFGIAKAIHQPLTDASVYTNIQQMVGTPLYMSPEQAQRAAQDVDTRTDVYSLGVLLYELLTGTTPFDKERFQQSSVDEVKRIIREEEPPRPSTRLSTVDAAQETIARTHQTDLRTLTQELSGELDWIVIKALEKDHNRRYESASDLAKDVQRYLDDEPVEACPPSTAYRLGKFYRRNKMVLTAAALILLALVAGSIGTAWQAIVATEQRAEAVLQQEEAEEQRDEANRQRTEANRQRELAQENFERARRAVDEYLTRVSEEELLDQPGLQPLRKDLLALALKYYQEFIEQSGDDPEVQAELAGAYSRIGKITKEIGSTDDAMKAHRKALALYEQLADDDPAIVSYQVGLAESYNKLSGLQRDVGNLDEAFALCQKALEMQDAVVREKPDVAEQEDSLAEFHQSLARLLEITGELDEAIISTKRAIKIQERLVAKHSDVPEYQETLSNTFNNLGILQIQLRRLDDAQTCFQNAIEISARLVAGHPGVPKYQSVLANAYGNLGTMHWKIRNDCEEALRSYQKSLEICERLVTENPSVHVYRENLSYCYNNVGGVHKVAKNWDEAIVSLQKSIEIKKKLAAENPNTLAYLSGLASSYNSVGNVQQDAGKWDEALVAYKKAIEIKEKLAIENPGIPAYRNNLGSYYRNLGMLYRRMGKGDEEVICYRKAIEIQETLVAENPSVPEYRDNLTSSYNSLTTFQMQTGEWDQAFVSAKRAIETAEALVTENPEVPLYRHSLARQCLNLGILQEGNGEWAETLVSCAKAIETLETQFVEQPGDRVSRSLLGQSYWRRGDVYLDLQQYDEAIADYSKAIELSPGDQSLFVQRAIARHRAGDQVGAQADLNKLASLNQKPTPAGQCRLASLYFAFDRNEEAVAECLKAIDLRANNHTDAFVRAGLLLLAERRDLYREACVDALERFGQKETPDSEVPRCCVLAPEALADPTEAVNVAEVCVAKSPPTAWALHTLGMAHLRAGQLDVAERRLRESLEAGPGWHARHLNDLGLVLVHHARGDSQQARASYAEAVALMDQRPASYTKIVQDWLEAHLLCREIEQLLGTPDEAKYAEAEQTRTTEDDADRGDQNQPGTEP